MEELNGPSAKMLHTIEEGERRARKKLMDNSIALKKDVLRAEAAAAAVEVVVDAWFLWDDLDTIMKWLYEGNSHSRVFSVPGKVHLSP